MTGRGLTFLLLSLLGFVLVGYGFFEARRLIEGPQIRILSPAAGSATSTLLTVSGTAQNISFLTINDSPAYTDEDGRFIKTLSPPPGYTVITVAATDRFGRRSEQSVSITMLNYCPVA